MVLKDKGDNGYYPIADFQTVPSALGTRATVRAKATGEFRPPRAGEWFLSGAIVEAYYQPRDGSEIHHHIAVLVPGEVITRWIPKG